ILERACREVVVDAGRSAVPPLDFPLEGAGWEEPLVQLFATAAERLVTALVGAGAEAVGRHAKGVHAKLRHPVSLSVAMEVCTMPGRSTPPETRLSCRQ